MSKALDNNLKLRPTVARLDQVLLLRLSEHHLRVVIEQAPDAVDRAI